MTTNDDGLHECAATGCTRRLSHRMLMCTRHWRMVPPALQKALYGAYKAERGGGGRAVITDEYAAAVRECVRSVQITEAHNASVRENMEREPERNDEPPEDVAQCT